MLPIARSLPRFVVTLPWTSVCTVFFVYRQADGDSKEGANAAFRENFLGGKALLECVVVESQRAHILRLSKHSLPMKP